jgi:hypothetical protein
MRVFFDAHFSEAAVGNFASRFLNSTDVSAHDAGASHAVDGAAADDEYWFDDEQCYEEEDDGLGYYPDGVKRTLTDEQIAMFRHSEMQALRRVKDREAEAWTGSPSASEETKVKVEDTAPVGAGIGTNDLSDGEIPQQSPIAGAPAKKKKKKRRPNRNRNNPEQIDLRKRTWDVVEIGLGSLEYDEEDDANSSAKNPAQRRRISYDED